jgi:hypothetical protein
MRDKDAQLMMEALEAGVRPSGGLPAGRRVSDEDIMERVNMMMYNYIRSGKSPIYANGILNDMPGLIDGSGDPDIRRRYEGWGKEDFIELQRILTSKFKQADAEANDRARDNERYGDLGKFWDDEEYAHRQ